MTTEIDRKAILLKAAYDILKQCEKSHYTKSLLETSAVYDDAWCDGYCLMDDIATELELDQNT